MTDYRRRTLAAVPSALAPRLWAGHLLMVVLASAAALLGLWQLDAWQTRRADEARDLTRADPVALSSVIGPDDPFPGRSVGQPVTLEGDWVPAGTVYVSGREHDGHDGYWMVTPLAVGGPSGSAIPVVLGWVADPGQAPSPPTGSARLVGWLQPPEGTGAVDDDPTDDVLPQLRIADLVQHVDQDLYGAYVVAEEGVVGLPAADLAQLPDVGTFTAIRNLLYAIEWWVFAGFAVLIWWRWVGEQRASEADEGTEESGHPAPDGEDHPDSVKQ
ncbi:MAG TPA: SURF1 family protein [Nocardioides sp.]|uniref:SURF1 family protein n=1 Tax=Nocardioides sp. TaxID=35761 RepID=UPI002E2EA9D3|nr:SURF1 family protein [Nocardioides sp.]HEX5089754.1 SURF1 family protein [Nocardioides sp.]